MRILAFSAILLLPLVLPAPASPATSDLDDLIRSEVARAESMDLGTIWARAQAIREAEALGTKGELDRLLEATLASGSAGPHATLLLAACRMNADGADASPLLDRLEPLLDATDPITFLGAAQLLGDPLFRGLSTEGRKGLGAALVRELQNPDRSPIGRMRAAASASTIGTGAHRRRARNEMKSFLSAADPDLMELGALALGEAGEPIEGELRTRLEAMARGFGARGRLATALLKQERIRSLYERKTQDLEERYANRRALPPRLQEFDAVLRMVHERHLEGESVDDEDLTAAALTGMLRAMDRHSSYMPSEVFTKFQQDLEAEYGGIGAYVNEVDGLFTIVRPIYSGPAYEAGLQTDDKVVRIGDWPTVDQPLEEIIKRLKGRPDTPVTLYIWRRSMDPDLIERPTPDMRVVVTRGLIEIPAVASQMLPGGIGMIELSTFSRVATAELRATIEIMLADGARGLLLDLRQNSGGLLTEARSVADLFLEPGLAVVSTEGRGAPAQTLSTTEPPVLPMEMPLIVLTSRFTASASEIVAGALQDHGRAIVLGERTFGKGSVQQLLPVTSLPQDEWLDKNRNRRWDTWEPIIVDHDGDGEVDYAPRVKLTIARYVLPSGRSIHRELDDEGVLISEGGIEPDEFVPYPLVEAWRIAEQRQLFGGDALRQYIDGLWAGNRKMLHELAICDLRDTRAWPGFNGFYSDLGTVLPEDDVRRLVRTEVRRRVQDERGAEFPPGDFQEDVQVQASIRQVLSSLGEDIDAYPAYASTFREPETDPMAGPSLALNHPSDREIARARSLIENALAGDGQLSRADLDTVLEFLSGL